LLWRSSCSSSGTWFAVGIKLVKVCTHIDCLSLLSEVVLDNTGCGSADVDGNLVGLDTCDDFIGFYVVAGTYYCK